MTPYYGSSYTTASMKGRELKAIRQRLGVSQAGVAKLLGVTQNTVSRWERDELRISKPVGRLIRIAGGEPVAAVLAGSKRAVKK